MQYQRQCVVYVSSRYIFGLSRVNALTTKQTRQPQPISCGDRHCSLHNHSDPFPFAPGVRNHTVLCRTRTCYIAERPSRTLDLGLGVTVKHSFPLLFSKDILILSDTSDYSAPSAFLSRFLCWANDHVPYLISLSFLLFFSIFPLSTSLLVYMVRARGIVLLASALATNMYKQLRRLVCAYIALSI